MSWQAFGETVVTLVVIMDPVGIMPIFIAATARLEAADRRRAALRATGAAAALILGFAFFGGLVLDYLNVDVASLSIAGGLLLLLVALEMLRGMDSFEGDAEGRGADVALVPLATPLVAGPGAIATVIVLSRQYDHGEGRLAVVLGILAALAAVGAALLLADRVARYIPDALIGFLTRVFGLLLSAIAVQLVVEGVSDTIEAR